MKTWEMIKELTENPGKTFCLYGHSHSQVFLDRAGVLCHTIIGNGSVTPLQVKLNTEWEEVVTWQEAFEAGMKGKKIKPAGQSHSFPVYDNLCVAFQYLSERPSYVNSLMQGDWYIEPENEGEKTAIETLNAINSKTEEGRLLITALAKLTSTIYKDKTPDEVLKILSGMAESIDWN